MIDLDNDPRLSAYVLDELDREEREVFEQDMANADGDAAELIAEIRRVAKRLEEAYANEPELRMTNEQRAVVLDGVSDSVALELAENVEDEDGKVLPWVVRATIGKEEKAAVAERLRPSKGQRAGRAILGLGIAATLLAGMFWVYSEMVQVKVYEDVATLEVIGEEYRDINVEKNEFHTIKKEKQSASTSPPRSEIVAYSMGRRSLELDVVDEALYDEIAGGLGWGPLGQSGGGEPLGGYNSAYFDSSSKYPGHVSGVSLETTLYPVDPSTTGDWDGGLVTGSGSLVMKSKSDSYESKADMEGLRTAISALANLEGDELVTAAVELGIQNPTLIKRYPEYKAAQLNHKQLLASGLAPKHPQVMQSEQTIEMLREMLVDAVDATERTIGTKMAIVEKTLKLQAEEKERDESYAKIIENPFKEVLEADNQLSTFSIDVDTASYANVRRMLRAGQKPPAAAVRIEEMVNYFKYDYPQPDGAHPFSANLEVAACPWAPGHRLVRIGLKGREKAAAERPDSNLVFLIDVSGSMQAPNKLSLLKSSMLGLVKNLREQDSVSIVAYAGSSGLVLDATSGALQNEIRTAIGRLEAGGSTNGGAGIQLAYRVAKEHYIKGGVNRVILATDGDFNVGVTDQEQLVKMVAERAKENVFLTVLGFGAGNLKDDLIEEISNRGNGNSFYIDSAREGHKVLVEEMGATLETIAKDVKIQVEFNPAKVQSYRLIGYENRMLRNRDFNNDKIDAGEVGAGHSVTALYEIVPVGAGGVVDELKYAAEKETDSPELLTLKLRYKQPEGTKSVKFTKPLVDEGRGWEESSGDFRFAASVAGFGMLLRDSEFKGELNYDLVIELAGEGIGEDVKGYRKEFLELVERAK